MFKWLIRIKHFCVLKFSSLKSISIYHQNSEDMGHSFIRPWKTKLSQNQKQKNCERVIYINQTKPHKRIKILGWYSYYIHVNYYFYINLRFMWPARLTRKVEKYGRSERDSNPDPPTLLFNPYDCCLISLKLSLLSKTYRQ